LNEKQEIEILLTIITIMDTRGTVDACAAAKHTFHKELLFFTLLFPTY